jgi:hypothetical protein
LQTKECVRALHAADQPSSLQFDTRWNAIQRRQEVHVRVAPAQLTCVLDEAVIRRLVGGPEVIDADLVYEEHAPGEPMVQIDAGVADRYAKRLNKLRSEAIGEKETLDLLQLAIEELSS